MKQIMKFNLWGNVVAVYHKESTDTLIIYQLCGKKKFFIDEVDSLDEAAQIAMTFC